MEDYDFMILSGKLVKIIIFVGVSSSKDGVNISEGLFKFVDEVLYKVKLIGWNWVCIVDEN